MPLIQDNKKYEVGESLGWVDGEEVIVLEASDSHVIIRLAGEDRRFTIHAPRTYPEPIQAHPQESLIRRVFGSASK